MKKKILACLLVFVIIANLLPPVAHMADPNTDAFGLPTGDPAWTAPPLASNPYGTTGWVTLFSVNEFYMAKGVGGNRSTSIQDTTPNFTHNTDFHNTGIMSVGNLKSSTSVTSSIEYAASVAFDPTGSGQKDHVANIGYNTNGYMTLWITNGSSTTVGTLDIRSGNSDAYKHMKSISGYNFDGYLQITAGDYDGDGKDSVMVYDPAMPKSDSSRPRVREYTYSSSSISATGQTFDPGPALKANDKYAQVIAYHNSSDSNRLRTTPTAHLTSGDIDKDGRDELVATYSFQTFPNDKYDSVSITERAVVTSIYEKSAGNIWQTPKDFVMQNDANRSGAERIRTSGAAAIGNFDPVDRGSNWPQIVVVGTWDNSGGTSSRAVSGKWGYGVIYCNSVDANGIGSYRLEGVQETNQNGITSGGIDTGDSVKPLAPVVAFKAGGGAGASYLFLSGSVCSIGSTGLQEEWTNSYFTKGDRGINGNIISNVHIIKPVAGNFDGNKEGREQVAFITLYKHESFNNYFWRLFTVGSESTGSSGENWRIATKGNVSSSGGLNNNESNFEIYKEPTGSNKNWISIAAIDIKNDAQLGKIKSITKQFSEASVLTIFESAPYFADLESVSPGYHLAGGTYYGTSKGSETSSSSSTSMHANIIVGYEYTEPLSQCGVDIEMTISNNFTWETEEAISLEYGIGYTSLPGQHAALVCRRPVIIYTFDALIPDGNGSYQPDEYILGMQQRPITGLISIDDYNTAAASMGLDMIDSSVIGSTPGEPSTYRRSTAGLTKLMIDTRQAPSPFAGSNAVTSMTIDQSQSQTNTFSYELDLDLKVVGKAGGLKFGGSFGGGWGTGKSTMDFSTIAMGGSVANCPNQDWAANYNFNWQFASWATELNGTQIPVLGYIVSGCSSPPSVPVNLSIVDIKSDSLTLQWEHGASPGDKYAIYRYVENDPIPERLLAVVSGATTEYLFNSDVRPETTYSFVIRAVSDQRGTSVRSAVATATTLPAGAGTMNVLGPGDTNVSAGSTAKFEVNVTGIPKEYTSTNYQWEVRSSNTGWQKLGGVSSSPQITVPNVTQEMNNNQYRCIVLATKGDGTLVNFYSRIATLGVGRGDTNAVLALTGAEGGGPGTTTLVPYYGLASYQEEQIVPDTILIDKPVTVIHNAQELLLHQVIATWGTNGNPLTYEPYYVGIGHDASNTASYYKVTKGTQDDFSDAVFAGWSLSSPYYENSTGTKLYDGDLDLLITTDSGVDYDTYLKITGTWNSALPTPDLSGAYDFTGVGLLTSAAGYTVYCGRFDDSGGSSTYTYYDSTFTPATLSADESSSLYTVFARNETTESTPVASNETHNTITTTWMIGRQEGYEFTVPPDNDWYADSFLQIYQLVRIYEWDTVDNIDSPPSISYRTTPANYVNIEELIDESSNATGKTMADLVLFTTRVPEIVNKSSFVDRDGRLVNVSATIKDTTSGAAVGSTSVAFTMTNLRTGAVSTTNAATSASGVASVSWRAPSAGMYSIVAVSTPTAQSNLAQSAPLYYLAMQNNANDQYVLQLKDTQGNEADTVVYGSTVALSVEEYKTTASGVDIAPYNGPAYYTVEYVDYNGDPQVITNGSNTSFMPPQAGSFLITATDLAAGGNVLASASLTVTRQPITLGVTTDILDTLPPVILKSGSWVGTDVFDCDGFIDVTCGLYNASTGAKIDITGAFNAMLSYRASLTTAAAQEKKELLAKYAVSFDTTTVYTVMPDQLLVYYTSGENGTIYGRQTAENLQFSSGTGIDLGTRLMFETWVNAGFAVKEWSVNGQVITASTANYTISPDQTTFIINSLSDAEDQNGSLTVSVAYKSANCLINFGAGVNGTVSAKADSGNNLTTGTRIMHGADITLTAAPEAGYVVGAWTVNNKTVYWPGTTTPYREKALRIDDVQEDKNINVSFVAETTYAVTTSAYGEDGNPSSSVSISAKTYGGDNINLSSVSGGTSLVFTAENLIQDNQIVKKWQVKKAGTQEFTDIFGSGGKAICTYYSVDSDFEIRAIVGTSQDFSLQFSVVDNRDNPVSGATIAASSAGSPLTAGMNTGFIEVSFDLTYDKYTYQVYNWVFNGTEQNVTDDTFTVASLDSNVTLKAILIKKPVVTVSSATNGDVYGDDGVTSVAGTSYTIPYGTTNPMVFYAEPAYGYEVSRFVVDGTQLTGTPDSGDTLAFTYTPPASGVVSDFTVVATFAAIPTYTINYAVFNTGSGIHGGISVEVSRKGMASYVESIAKSDTGSVTVFRDSEVSFVSEPDSSFVLQNWIINDSSTNIVTSDLTRTITDGSIQKVETQFTSKYGKMIVGTDGNGSAEATRKGTSVTIANGANIESEFDALFTATPNTGYKFSYWEVDGQTDSDKSNPLEKRATTNGMSVIAHFEGNDHSVIYSADGNGTLEAFAGVTAVAIGTVMKFDDSIRFIATPDAYYVLEGFYLNGTEVTAGVNGLVYDTKVAGDMNVVAKFLPGDNIIEYSSGANGTVSAALGGINFATASSAKTGQRIVFNAVPNTDYKVNAWLVNNIPVTGEKGNTFTLDVAGDAMVKVEFIKKQFMVTFDVDGANGTVSATVDGNAIQSGDMVSTDKTVTFTATPDADHMPDAWTIDTVRQTTDVLTQQIDIAADTDVKVSFVPIPSYTLNFDSIGKGAGKIMVNGAAAAASGSLTVKKYDTVTLVAVPDDAYNEFSCWYVDTVLNQEPTDTLVINGFNRDVTVEAEFVVLLSYDVSFSAGAGGTISATANGSSITHPAAGKVSVSGNSKLEFTAAPNAGMVVSEWLVNGVVIQNNLSNVLVIPSLADNVDITVRFKTYSAADYVGLTTIYDSNEVAVNVTSFPDPQNPATKIAVGHELRIEVKPLSAYSISTFEIGTTVVTVDANGKLSVNPNGDPAVLNNLSFTAQNGTLIYYLDSVPNAGDITITITATAGYVLTITPPANGSIAASIGGQSITSGSAVRAGTQITLVATPNSNYTFSSWTLSGGGTFSTTAASTIFTMANGDATIGANFSSSGGGGGGGGGGAIKDDPDIPLDSHIQYISGYQDGSVRPNQVITRAEVCMMLFRLMEEEDKNQPFDTKIPDVSPGDWYYQAVTYLENIDVITGYPDGTFGPNNPITRAEFVTIISRLGEIDARGPVMFPDIIGHWAQEFIQNVANKGWINGYPDGAFMPNNLLTRAEAITIINRMLNRSIDPSNLPEWAPTFIDLSPAHWAYADIIEASVGHEYERDENGKELWAEES